MSAVYLDHNATTPLDPRVLDAMLPWLSGAHGNPSSVHAFGRLAREAIEGARDTLARVLGGLAPEWLFAASGTEANNAVILGLAHRARTGARELPGHLVVSALEHPSVLAAANRLEAAGFDVTRLLPDGSGVVDVERVAHSLRADTFLVCLMLANNEVGSIQPVRQAAEVCRERGVPVLCDAVQAVGKIPVDVEDLAVEYLTLGAHKFYGPLGAAALRVRGGAPFESYLVGGGQERRRRAGTENVPAIVGLGAALELVESELEERAGTMASLRDRFELGLGHLRGVSIHAGGAARLPNTSSIAFEGVAADSLMIRLDLAGFAVSAGSACSSGKAEPSATLSAMGIDPNQARGTVRVSFGPTNTVEETDRFLEVLEREVSTLRRDARLPAPGGMTGTARR